MTDCQAKHFGPWAIELVWFQEAINALNRGLIVAKIPAAQPQPVQGEYQITPEGVAQFEISGHMMKGWSKYGGSNSVALKRSLRKASLDQSVKAIMLAIDSPGGTVAGTEDLANEVSYANMRKPVYAHISDLGASAAYWVASQARRIYATSTSEIGSIGTLAVIPDTSEAAQKEGVKVHVISTGAYKGVGVPGTEIKQEDLQYLAARVEALNSHFLEAVAMGRGASIQKVEEEWGNGQVWIADKAWQMGLIDGVKTYDEAYRDLVQAIPQDYSQSIQRMQNRLRLQEVKNLLTNHNFQI